MIEGARALLRRPVVRFLLVGGSNTLVTGALVSVLSLWLPGWLAFTIAFALGIGYSTALMGRWVFGGGTRRQSLLFALAYVVIFAVGQGLILIFHAVGLPPWANGLTVLVTAPLSFVAGRLIFTRSAVNSQT